MSEKSNEPQVTVELYRIICNTIRSRMILIKSPCPNIVNVRILIIYALYVGL